MELYQQLRAQYGVNQDPELNAQLDRIMANLTKGIGTVDPTIYDMPYNYFINNEKSFNAFCTLGHNLSVNRGLFSILTMEDEVAVVLAHEMGHGQKNHSAKGMQRSILPQILANATGSIVGVLAANVWNNQGITKPMEWEADNMAFEYITHTPYNPGATAAVWQRVMDNTKGGGDSALLFLFGGSDHPSEKSRRDNYMKKLTEYSGGHVEQKDGQVLVNGEVFAFPADAGGMSGEERACLVMGNLASAYHNGHNKSDVTVNGQTVMMGPQAIITAQDGDESAEELASRLAAIK